MIALPDHLDLSRWIGNNKKLHDPTLTARHLSLAPINTHRENGRNPQRAALALEWLAPTESYLGFGTISERLAPMGISPFSSSLLGSPTTRHP